MSAEEVGRSRGLFGGLSALQLFEAERSQRPIPTFCHELDLLLGGGVMPGPGLFEVCGAPGAGKTQFCMQMCIDVQIPVEFGGLGRKAVYVDSEGSFLVERLAFIARGLCDHLLRLAERRANPQLLQTARKVSVRSLLEGVYVFRVFDHVELLATVLTLENFICGLNAQRLADNAGKENAEPSKGTTAASSNSSSSVGVVIVDSVSFPYRHSFSGSLPSTGGGGAGRGAPSSALAERTTQLLNLANSLNRLAQRHHLAVIVSNQMTTKIRQNRRHTVGGGDDASDNNHNQKATTRLEPALGSSWSHVPNTRLLLESSGGEPAARTATLIKSNWRESGCAAFQIQNEGIRDVRKT